MFGRKSHILRFLGIILMSLIIILMTSLILSRSSSRRASLPIEIPLPPQCVQFCPYNMSLTFDRVHFDANHSIRHFPDFVCPQNFRNLADWVFGWPDQFNEQMEKTTDNGLNIAPCLPHGSIIYVRHWATDEFFKNVYPHLINSFVLITGESDVSSPNNLRYLEESDSKIIHWFGQNGQYDASKIKKFTHIPIGKLDCVNEENPYSSRSPFGILLNAPLREESKDCESNHDLFISGINCYEMAAAIQGVYSQQPNHTLPQIFGEGDEPARYIQPMDVSRKVRDPNGHWRRNMGKLILINFDKATDGSGLRSQIWKDMCQGNRSISFAQCYIKPGGVDISALPSIYPRNRQYPFWLSPRGGGIDCHRTWEALYLDIVPIVWNTSLNVLYDNLPVLIIDDHRTLTQEFLRNKLQEFTEKKFAQSNSKTIYQYEKLRNAYWRRLILEQSRHKAMTNGYTRQRLCWRAQMKNVVSA